MILKPKKKPKGQSKLATVTKKKQKQESFPTTVEGLRRLGFKVRVYHARLYFAPEHFARVFVSKREAEQMNLALSGYALNSHCGYTKLEITTPDGVELTGKYSFGNRQFNRKLGLRAAIGRAFKGSRSRRSI